MKKLLLASPLLFAAVLQADTLELKTGERLQGAFRQATSAGAVIEVAGQAITIPMEKVEAIYLGDPPEKSPAPEPTTETLSGVRAVGSVTASGIVTMAKYNMISNGMSYQQVWNIIGTLGQEMSRSDLAGFSTVMYMWRNPDGSNMNAMFQNGSLISKAQFGLPLGDQQAPPAIAQKPLTNADIAGMAERKVLGTTIVQTIDDAKAVDFKVGPGDLHALEMAGVSPPIINMMIDRQAAEDAKRADVAQAPAVEKQNVASSAQGAFQDEAHAAYQVAVQCISMHLKAPATAQFSTFESAKLSPGGAGHRGWTVVRMYVDAQNSFGAMLRKLWTSHVSPQTPDGKYRFYCNEGIL